MTDLYQRLAKLTPEQQALLTRRLRAKGLQLPESKELATQRDPRVDHPDAPVVADRSKGMQFSLLCFSGDGTTDRDDKYDFLLECARFADAHGFQAVWTPERHFQAFGGLFPNPSVLSAALAMATECLQIRAGSVVIPLHHPIRLAEEWSLVDNLSKGRVAISVATGWNRGDFTLAPDAYESRREIAFRNLTLIQRLWAGEQIAFPSVDGQAFPVTLLPKPLQPQLPIWVTVSGSPDTWGKAGEIGANVLTAMGGAPEDLMPDINRYREARRQHGHDPRTGIVSVMMHTFIGEAESVVKATVKAPLSRYLQTFIAQDEVLSEDQTGMDAGSISTRDRQELIDFAFERYFHESGLLGTPDHCDRMVARMQAAGVDDIACLVDFGVDHEAVRESLRHVSELCQRYAVKQAIGA